MKFRNVPQWVGDAMKSAGMANQADFARRMTAVLNRDIDRSVPGKILDGTRDLTIEEMFAIEQITGFAAPSRFAAIQVRQLDWVQAGKLAEPRSQIPVEDVPLLAFADLGQGEFFALKVEGDSMDRVSPEGSVIVVDRRDKQLVNGRCYVFSVRGETTYKRWHKDPAYLEPDSWNPVNKPIFLKRKRDLEVIGRVRRTVLDL